MEIYIAASDTLYLIGAMSLVGLMLQIGAADGGGTDTLRGRIIMLAVAVFIAPLTWCAVMFFTTATPTSWWDTTESIRVGFGYNARATLLTLMNLLFPVAVLAAPLIVVLTIWRIRKMRPQSARAATAR